MNLVQINEHLKEVAPQKLIEYQNGLNPEVPAWMAQGELNRREAMNKREQENQAAQGAGAPTLKDQLEQKAGLMALQAQQQKQAQQQMMQQGQQQPMPVPEGIPQPQPQEEAQMAMGGVAQLPIGSEFFQYGSGGIIAFAGEQRSDVPVAETPEEARRREMQEIIRSAQGQQSTIPQPAPTAQNQLDPEFLAAAKETLKVQTPEDIMAAQTRMKELAGVKGQYGDQAEAGIRKQQEEYQKAISDRDYERVMAVLGGMARGSLGGAGPAYLAQMSAERSADQANTKEQNKLLAEIEAARRQEAIGMATAGLGFLEKQRTERGTTGRTFAAEAFRAGNELDREKARYANEIELAKSRFANEKELAEIRSKHDIKLEGIRAGSARALEEFRQGAPTQDKKNFDDYYRMFKADPKNAEKTEAEAFAQYHIDKSSGRLESSRNALVERHLQDWNKMDLMEKDNWKKQGVNNAEDYAQRMLEFTEKMKKPATGGAKEGDKATSNSGKPIIYRNGKWEYA